MLLRARAVLPLNRPPIADGAVQVSGNRVVRAGRWRDLSNDAHGGVLDLGETVLLPGLVNAHCHLDYTGMAGKFPPQKNFPDWIKLITAAKSEWSYTEFAGSWLSGAAMLTRTGTTTVADFEAVPELLPEVWDSTALRVFSFLELTGVRSRRPPAEILGEALARIDSLPGHRCCARFAPHAPYSTVPELLRLCSATAAQRDWPFSLHLAESSPEFDMFLHARGALHDWLRQNQREMADCGLGSPVQAAHRCGALRSNLLAVHVNYLGQNDASLLATQKVSVAHCPRSHAYFKHQPFPLASLSRARVNLCLGTDSLASVYKKPRQTVELNLFTEMQTLAAAQPALKPAAILRMATVNGARALGMAGQIGEITQGAFADLIALPFSGPMPTIHEAVLQHRGNVSASLINGQWAIPLR